MRKQRQNNVSSVPPKKVTNTEFEDEIRSWLKRKGKFSSIVADDQWVFDRFIPRDAFFEWGKSVIPLKIIYRKYRINPHKILNHLGIHKIRTLSKDQFLSGDWVQRWDGSVLSVTGSLSIEEFKAKIRSLRLREKDALVLGKAADIAAQWKRYLDGPLYFHPAAGDPYPSPASLKKLAKIIKETGPAKSHRPEEVELKVCAQGLASLFKETTGLPLYGYVGDLIRCAFPERWNPAGDLREAAKKLVKGGKENYWDYFGPPYSQDLMRSLKKESKTSLTISSSLPEKANQHLLHRPR